MKTMAIICGCLIAATVATAHDKTTSRKVRTINYSGSMYDESFRDVRTGGRNEDPDSGMASPIGAMKISDMNDYADSPVYSIQDDLGSSPTAGFPSETVEDKKLDYQLDEMSHSNGPEKTERFDSAPAAKAPASASAPVTSEANGSEMSSTGASSRSDHDGRGAMETREMKQQMKTAEDQSKKENDLEITRQIRREIMNSDDLSTRAQNLTVITEEGKVTLRGTVPSANEKTKVVDMARSVNGVSNVDSSQVTVAR
jgi:hypothetical protein